LQAGADVGAPAGQHLVVFAVELDEQRARRLQHPRRHLRDELLARGGPAEPDHEALRVGGLELVGDRGEDLDELRVPFPPRDGQLPLALLRLLRAAQLPALHLPLGFAPLPLELGVAGELLLQRRLEVAHRIGPLFGEPPQARATMPATGTTGEATQCRRSCRCAKRPRPPRPRWRSCPPPARTRRSRRWPPPWTAPTSPSWRPTPPTSPPRARRACRRR